MPIVTAEKISKCFRIYRHPSDHLKELFHLGRRRYHEPFWAVKDVDLSIERAVPVGLILNEAATNSIKHAFGQAGGRITVKLVTGLRFGQARLAIADNGKGMDAATEAGSGRTLIAGLARQIGGAVSYESTSQGTAVSLTFPVVV